MYIHHHVQVIKYVNLGFGPCIAFLSWVVFMGPAVDSRIKPPDAGIPVKSGPLNIAPQLSNVQCIQKSHNFQVWCPRCPSSYSGAHRIDRNTNTWEKFPEFYFRAGGFDAFAPRSETHAKPTFLRIVQSGGPFWDVELGRRDSLTASKSAANNAIPKPTFNVPQLTASFKAVGLNEQDVVALSGTCHVYICCDPIPTPPLVSQSEELRASRWILETISV